MQGSGKMTTVELPYVKYLSLEFNGFGHPNYFFFKVFPPQYHEYLDTLKFFLGPIEFEILITLMCD
jgi:hypothetical protein